MAHIRRFIDIGANLTDLMYVGIYNGNKKHEEDLYHVLERSWKAGLEKIIITGGNCEESHKALEIAKINDRLYTTVGCHPTRCLEFETKGSTPDSYSDKLKSLIQSDQKKIVAVGECGLDYDRLQFCPKDVQKKYFEVQVKMSQLFKLPLFLHCRNSAQDLFNILNNYQDIKGVVHSFDGTLEEAEKFMNLGYYIGINGCSLKTQENLDTVSKLPLDKILIETDCPWCEIRPSHAGYKYIAQENHFESVKKEKWRPEVMVKSRNEPANIRQVFDIIAAVRNEDPNIICEKILSNTNELFFERTE